MSKKWDYNIPDIDVWVEVLRVLKPGGHLLCFGGTRTFHRVAVSIEDAGFDIRDTIMWVYGSGFPKSLDVGKAIDATIITGGSSYSAMADVEDSKNAPLAEDDDSFISYGNKGSKQGKLRHGKRRTKTDSITTDAQQWQGWGTALKPAWEPIILARKPFGTTVAENVLKYGTGALNIDGCRVETEEQIANHSRSKESSKSKGKYGDSIEQPTHQTSGQVLGRFPANLIHNGSDEVVSLFPNTTSGKMKANQPRKASLKKGGYHDGMPDTATLTDTYGDNGSAARFFYCAKASKQDREAGCTTIETKQQDTGRKKGNVGGDNPRNRGVNERHNNHPTVKPTELMKYLCRLITPPSGTILDPFMGSGSTGKAAVLEGFNFIGIEIDEQYIEIARRRIDHVTPEPNPFIDGE